MKAQTVKLVTDQGESLPEVARDLDKRMLRAWKQAWDKDGDQALSGIGNLLALEEKLRGLRLEVKRLSIGFDILKEATNLFARE